MQQFILACSHENLSAAQASAGVWGARTVQYITPADTPDFVAKLVQQPLPVLIWLTDNWLKSSVCMDGLLSVYRQLQVEQRVQVVVANAVQIADDGQINTIETHIDRIVNAIQYMNFWQYAYLKASEQYYHVPDSDKDTAMLEMERTHHIADQMGDFISAVREAGYMQEADLATDASQMMNLWLGETNEEVAPAPVEVIAPVPTVETAPSAVETPTLQQEITPPTPETPTTTPPLATSGFHFDVKQHIINETPDPADSPLNQYMTEEIEMTIKDAWEWLEQGRIALGIEVFELAIEQYPDNTQVKQEYEKALEYARLNPEKPRSFDDEEMQEPVVLNPPAAPEFSAADDIDEDFDADALTEHSDEEEESASNPREEAASYFATGEGAMEDGDYLMAKYCWDRAAEIDPEIPGVWAALAQLTANQLPEYRETGLVYLQKALSADPGNPELLALQATLNAETPTPPETPTPQPVEPLIQLPEPLAPPVVKAEQTPQPIVKSSRSRAKIALVTGATSGIGRATAREFAQLGWKLIVTGRRADRLLELQSDLEKNYNSAVLALCFDVRDQAATEAQLTQLPPDWADIDVLVNNAGLAKGLAPIHEGDLVHWETMIDTNIKGLLYVSRCITPGMVKRQRGHVINVGSSAGKEAYANGNVYCATKFAVEALTKSMRFDLHQYNIRVSQVSPGHVEETEFALNRFDGDAQRAQIYEDFEPLTAKDVAEAIIFMATRPAHVNIQDIYMFGTQQASATVIDRSGR
jgi:NADP-dependent 3-hydroxy acid dehydrogenase YdfG